MPSSGRCPLPTSHFTGRTTEVELVQLYFGNDEQERQVFVLHGLGGAGKTQTALRVAELMAPRFEGVVYIDGASRENIETTLSGFAASKHLGNTHRDALNWIGSRKPRWLMLFDNVDDPEVRVHEYFPRSGRYSVLVTTRHEEVARLAQDKRARWDAYCLLLKTAGLNAEGLEDSEKTAATLLLQELGYLALAVVQCGTFIYNKCTIARYYEMYLAERQEILEGNDAAAAKIEGYDRSLHATWELSYKRLGETSKRLLGLSAFLNRDHISEELFRRASANIAMYQPAIPPTNIEAEAQQDVKEILGTFINKNGNWSSRLFLSVMGELVSLSLVMFDTSVHVYRLHPLVQQWARILPSNPKMAIERSAFLLALAIDRKKRSEDYAFRRGLAPHVNELIDLCPMPNSNNAWQFGEVCAEVGQVSRAEQLELQVLEARIYVLGHEHPDTLRSMLCVARTRREKGQLKGAETLEEQVLNGRKRVLRNDHPDTLEGMASLATTYYRQGRFAEAEIVKVEVLVARKRMLGGDHPATLRTMDDLAATYNAQGRLAEAEALKVEVVSAQKRVFGADNPITLDGMASLAVTYQTQGRLVEAEALKAEVLDARKRLLGDEHPETLMSMSNLAVTYREQGRLAEAEILLMETLTARKRLLGDEHPETLRSTLALARTYHAQGRLVDAETLKLEALAGRQRVLGGDHHDTLWIVENLATVCHAQGRLAEAAALQIELIASHKRVFGDDHPETMKAIRGLAQVYEQSQFSDRKHTQTSKNTKIERA